MLFQRRGFCLILSSPSGAGKSTLARALLAHDPGFQLSISVTTRPPRPQEAHGTDYLFATEEEFLGLRDKGKLLEWAKVFGNYYGTPAAPVEACLASGGDMLFDVDWQGANALTQRLGKDIAKVFIMPPSRDELERRIHGRATDSPEVIATRLAEADLEMSHWQDYDYILVNHDVDECLAQLEAIVAAERAKPHRQTGMAAFAQSLMRR